MGSKDTKLKIIVDAENRTQGVFNTLTGNLDTIRKSHEGLISSMKTVGAVGTAAFAGLSLLTAGIVKAGAGFEQTQIAFETMLGSADLAKKSLADLSKFAARTPFELMQLEEASKRLLAYGLTAEDLIPTLRMLGDISAGVGMDKLPQLILAFGQVKAATKLTGMELRQFSEAGVPLLGTLAAQLNKTEGEILEMVSEGKIGFAQVQSALASLTGEGGRFFNLMERQSQSLGGQWSNFKDQIALTARAIGTELLPYLKPVLDNLIGIAQAIGGFVKEHPRLAAMLLVAVVGFTALMAALLPIAIALPGLILMWTGFAAAIAFVVSGPGIAIVATIGAIAAALWYLYERGYFTKQGWQEVWTGIKIIAAESANAIIATVEGMVNFIINGVNTAIRMINKVIGLAQKVPGLGSKISKIGELGAVNFGRYDTDMIAANDLNYRPTVAASSPPIVVTGNTFLSEDAAEKLGDLILGRLKFSNPI